MSDILEEISFLSDHHPVIGYFKIEAQSIDTSQISPISPIYRPSKILPTLEQMNEWKESLVQDYKREEMEEDEFIEKVSKSINSWSIKWAKELLGLKFSDITATHSMGKSIIKNAKFGLTNKLKKICESSHHILLTSLINNKECDLRGICEKIKATYQQIPKPIFPLILKSQYNFKLEAIEDININKNQCKKAMKRLVRKMLRQQSNETIQNILNRISDNPNYIYKLTHPKSCEITLSTIFHQSSI